MSEISIEILESDAEMGDAKAALKLGRAYENGSSQLAVTQDYFQALYWYGLAREYGSEHGEIAISRIERRMANEFLDEITKVDKDGNKIKPKNTFKHPPRKTSFFDDYTSDFDDLESDQDDGITYKNLGFGSSSEFDSD